jgi:ribulose-5-phosphate 4-epimerase/fuculose-1-phosphate aldolase
MFHEVTASNLVKIDLDGNIVAPSEYRVNSAGFVIHSAIHMGREDLVCVLHTHTEAGMAVSALKSGLLPVCQTSAEFYNRVAYHDYEGLATDLDERARLVRDLGDKKLMILRNHGLLTCGATAAEAFYYMYYLDKACRVQVKAMMTGELRLPPPEVAEHTARQSEVNQPKGEAVWRALTRQLDREDPSYRN